MALPPLVTVPLRHPSLGAGTHRRRPPPVVKRRRRLRALVCVARQPSRARLDDAEPIHYQGAMDGNSLTQWMSTVFARSERGADRPGDYFTPKLTHADRQLQTLAARAGGTYQRGVLDWPAFAAPPGAPDSPGAPGEALWGRGSRVRRTMHGLDIELTVGVQPLSTGPGDDGASARWLVLAPGVTVMAGPRSAPLSFDRFDASWSADEETATGAERLRHLLARRAAPSPPLPSMPPSVISARDRLIEKASRIVCAKDHVFVVGRPLPRAPGEPRHFGQGAFELDALLDLTDRARAFAHALATS